MITTTIMGGLGNSLFQISMLLAYSLKYKVDYCIPAEIKYPHAEGQAQFISPKLNYCDKKLDLPIYPEKFFEYNEIPGYMDNICFQGYWQSYKYFQDYRPEILTLLNIPKAIGYGKIFLHYRLGDYKDLGRFHKIISDQYIEEALELFYDKGYRDVMVFSDEIELAKKRFHGNIFNWQFSEGRSEIQDLALMAACSGGIISASSFSWWGAWFGHQDRMIIYPKDWFGEELKHDIKDLPMPNWIGI